MKKIFSLIILILMICVIPLSGIIAFAEGGIFNVRDTEFHMLEFLEEFVTVHRNRLAGTAGESAAADFIAAEFKKLVDENNGYIPYHNGLETEENNETETGEEDRVTYEKFYQRFDFLKNGTIAYSKNVILTKLAGVQNTDTKTVIIGAHYDNAYILPDGVNASNYKMQGAYDNGTGVALMLDLANRIKDENFDFNITFIAFGAEEYTLKGSEYYVNRLNEEELNNILIMFNLDVVGAGDKLYLYCDEIKTEHEKFLLERAKAEGIELNSPPLDKHVTLYGIGDMPYSHTGFMSDNLSFLNEGVNTAFFFTYNWNTGFSESSKYPSMMHTSNDNMDVLKERYADTYEKFMDDTGDIIYAALMHNGFKEKMILSLNNKFNYRPFMSRTTVLITAVVILTLTGVLVILTYYMLNKNKIKPPEVTVNVFGGKSEEKNETVFGEDFEDNEDDIFK